MQLEETAAPRGGQHRPRVALVGVSGYGRVHLDHLCTLHDRNELVLAAVVVINPVEEAATCQRLEKLGCRILPDQAALLAALAVLRLDLAVVPTPIYLHGQLSIALLRAGVNVLVEKPLAATVGEAAAVAAAAEVAARVAAVGFQYLHAVEVQALKQRLVAGAIGPVRRVTLLAAWPRSHRYYARNNWAGRQRISAGWVLDSPVSNALAHFFLLLLYFSGRTLRDGARVRRMSGELYRAQPIESFDTAALAMETEDGCVLEFYGTHSSREITRPVLRIEGATGHAEWVQDGHARLAGPDGTWQLAAEPEAANRERMLRDVLARVAGADRFVCGPTLALEHVRCVNALHELLRIHDLPPAAVSRREEAGEVFTWVPGIDVVLKAAAARHSSLGAAGAAWAVPPVGVPLQDYRGIA